MIQIDTYNTIDNSFEGDIFKDRGSKFIGFSFPVTSENQVK
ncbi:MAG: hypothetical protein ACI8RP_001413, partial [Urechidicola sp.]